MSGSGVLLPGQAIIGWVGVGKMGLPMATRALASGFAVRAFDPVAANLDALSARGATVAESVADASRGADVIVSSLPDDDALGRVALGDRGVLAAARAGAVFIETSTVSPSVSARIAREASERGVEYVRVAVSGNPVLAQAGTLTVLASGPKSVWDRVRPLLDCFGDKQFHVGEAEQARTLKLVINLMIAVSAGMIAEALALGRRGGLDWGTMLGVIESSAVASPMVKYKAPVLRERDFASTFSCLQMMKDLDLILDAGKATGVPLALTALTRQMYGAAAGLGLAEDDYIATVRLVERLSGLEDIAGINKGGGT